MKKILLKTLFTPLCMVSVITISTTHTNISLCQTNTESVLSEYVNKIEYAVCDAQTWFNNFFDASNKDSYKKHVDDFKNKLHKIEETIVKPFENTTREISQNASGIQIEITNQINQIIHQVYDCLFDIYKVLDKHRGASVTTLKNGLTGMQDTLAQDLVIIESKLQKLHALCTKEGVNFTRKISDLHAKLEALLIQKANKTQLLHGLMTRVNAK